jgi:hypothetical protein
LGVPWVDIFGAILISMKLGFLVSDFGLFSVFLAGFLALEFVGDLAEVVLGWLSLTDPDLALVFDGTGLVNSFSFDFVEIFLLDLSVSVILALLFDFAGVLLAFLSGVLLVCALRDFWLP